MQDEVLGDLVQFGAILRDVLDSRHVGARRAPDPVRQLQYPAGSGRIWPKIEPWF
jgi:hypothetical protein